MASIIHNAELWFDWFIDDYLKLKKFSFKGLSGKIKIIIQSFITLIFCYLLLLFSEAEQYAAFISNI